MRRYAIIYRLGAGAMLMVCWVNMGSPMSGVVFALAMASLSAVRYRFAPYKWLGAVEAAACLCYALIWPPALLGLWLPAIGLLEDKWEAWERDLLEKSFEDRGKRLKLEASAEAAARELRNAARLAEMAERSRIAQDIHDHVGHEISGASIALQTALKLYEKGDPRAGGLLVQTAKRLDAASEHLREAVHNLKPSRVAGADTLAELCEEFAFCPALFSATGNLGGGPDWGLLEANLKEALTNVSRHSDASLVTVKLDGNYEYIRMRVSDNGNMRMSASDNGNMRKNVSNNDIAAGAPKMGLGLSGIRERVRAAGGHMTVSREGGFTLTTVLPKRGAGPDGAGRSIDGSGDVGGDANNERDINGFTDC